MQGGLWDPDAGLVIPRSQTVAGKLVDHAIAAGKLYIRTQRRLYAFGPAPHSSGGEIRSAPFRQLWGPRSRAFLQELRGLVPAHFLGRSVQRLDLQVAEVDRRSGVLALQAGAPIYFRNLKIKALD